MGKSKRAIRTMGFSLIEILVSIIVSTVLVGILFTVCIRVEVLAGRISENLEQSTSLRMSPLLLNRWIKEAGMNLHDQGEEYLEADGGEVRVRSDSSGKDGLPDGDTDDSFEDIRIRAVKDELKIKSGKGGFQPCLRGISRLSASRRAQDLLALELESVGNRPGIKRADRMMALFKLWNERPNLFPEETE